MLNGQGPLGPGAGSTAPWAVGASQGPALLAPATAALAASGTSATISVKATDTGSLTYNWSLIGPAYGRVTFAANNSSAACNDTVTFSSAGTYSFMVWITDSSGHWAASAVTVTVSHILSGITVTPSVPTLVAGTREQFYASAYDQFGNAMALWTPITWSSSAGTITPYGLFTASGASNVTITAQSGPVSGKTTVTVAALPTITSPLTATLNSTLTGAALQIRATDSLGGTDLSYDWSTVSAPSGGAAAFTANDSNAAANTSATFNKAGTYTFQVLVVERSGLDIAKTISVTVTSVTKINVTPATATLAAGATQQFAAKEVDQFGNALATQPAFTWSATAGTIGGTGLLTAPQTAGSLTVTARSSSFAGTATVTVTAGGGGTSLSLHDQQLAALVQTLDAGGSITRNDMLTIFNDVESNYSTLSANELADLRTIVADAAALNMPGYVRVLATDVVDGNSANAHYQGAALGNLAAGSSTNPAHRPGGQVVPRDRSPLRPRPDLRFGRGLAVWQQRSVVHRRATRRAGRLLLHLVDGDDRQELALGDREHDHRQRRRHLHRPLVMRARRAMSATPTARAPRASPARPRPTT